MVDQTTTSEFLKKLLQRDNNSQWNTELDESDHLLFDYYQAFVENHQDIIYVVSLEGEIVTRNKNIFSYLGYSETQNLQYDDLMSEDDYHLIKQLFKKAQKGKTSDAKISLRQKGGDTVYFAVSFFAIKSSENHIAGIYIVGQNKTNEVTLKSELSNKNDFYKTIFDNLEVGIWAWDYKKDELTFASKGLEKITEIPMKDIFARKYSWDEMIPDTYQELLSNNLQLIHKGQRVKQTYQMKLTNGKLIWLYEQIIPQLNEHGEVINLFGLVMDVTERESLREQIQFMLHYDQVTTLPNQQKLFDQLDQLTNYQNKPFAFVTLSINNFDWYNNSLGHLIGEKILRRLANKLFKTLSKEATLYKTALNEFTCTIENYKTKDGVFYCIEEMLKDVEGEIEIKGYRIHLQASVGVSFYPEHGAEKHEIIRNAQSALYHARQMGEQNFQLYSHDRDTYSLKKYMLQQDLMNALKGNEFELYFQPIVDGMTGEIVWSEALIRWNHQEWGVVSPEEFISIAEEQHVIHEITDWTIQKVCMQLREWKNKGKNVRPIAINISPLRFLKKDIVSVIENGMKTYQIPSEHIILELTEGVAVSKELIFLDTLKSIKQLGIKIALDDFGTGYASFQHLYQFDFDIIKIDKSFVSQLQNEDSKNRAIVISMIKLAKSLNMSLVGEGVEEKEDLRFLKENGCQLIQGYIYSPPVPNDIFVNLLDKPRLKLEKVAPNKTDDLERREFFRFHFPGSLVAQMDIVEINNKKVNVGSTNILVDNISLGGLKFYSFLRLPTNPHMVLRFKQNIMGTKFSFGGNIVRANEERAELFSYGVIFKDVSEGEKDKLAEVINRMTALQRLKEEIPNTEIIKVSPIKYLKKQEK